MRRWLTMVLVGAIAGAAVPSAAKVPTNSQGKTLSARELKKARKATAAKGRKARPGKVRKPSLAPAGTVQVNTPQSLRLAIRDLAGTFGAKYAGGPAYLARLDKIETRLKAGDPAAAAELDALARQALLANPLLDFDRLIVRRTADLGLPANWQSNSSLGRANYDNEIATLSPVSPDGRLTTLYRPAGATDFVGDVDLHFDARKLLFSRSNGATSWVVCEIGVSPKGTSAAPPRTLPLPLATGVDSYDGCYLPDDNIIFTSTAAMTGVPCVGGSSPVTNLFRLETATGAIRRLTFDQDHDWYPAMMNSGRVMYLRWEYSDISHAFSRILFSMNPDGTNQVAHYGSNSYWPNALFYARAIPGQAGKFVAIVSGHHGLRRMGELVLFDTAKGRYEADGVVQRIPGRGKAVEPVILDNVAGGASPRFLHPWPLSGKYFLVAAQVRGQKRWGIYLVDVFDNVTLVKDDPTHHLVEPVPLRKRPRPPVVPSRVDLKRKDALIHVVDIYAGEGLKGVPRGAIKKLRLFTYNFAYYGMGGQGNRIGVDGPWDVKRIVGTVPVEPDGSVLFRAPANTPLSLQPLDADGKAVQRMRSWLTAMPGETLSCVGCHEKPGTVPVVTRPLALKREPAEITPWYGPDRGFSFAREVQQPVLDKYCIGCHDGKRRQDGKAPPDLTARPREARTFHIMLGRNHKCNFTPSYWTLRAYVRSTNEADNHLLLPYEFSADSSKLIRMLRKGHHNVSLPPEAWDRLITWIDLSAPAYGTWSENVGAAKVDRYRTVRKDLLKLYANVDEDPELILRHTSASATPVMPPAESPRVTAVPRVEGWPFDAAEAKRRQARDGRETKRTFDLGKDVKLAMTLIPPGRFVMGDPTGHRDEGPPAAVKIAEPFWMGTFEVTNAQFALFDATHDSRLEAYPGNNFSVRHRGELVNGPTQPVCRVSQTQARAFCKWLSKRTGRQFALPTEAQWEYACRAGTAGPLYFGRPTDDHSPHANLADVTSKKVWHWLQPGESMFNDKAFATAAVGSYRPNAWGLHDMHGNVAEWTCSPYRPYPFRADARAAPTDKVAVRGGSWNDRAVNARSSVRQMYRPHERAYDVGFRVICKP
ncbi:MAG: SUMF1/EgtB/PvdO family nonheme iron enzyme [Phycisphaerae bacterium]|nr:SUMF1/EgtB/PvdO family nonheme iron enzyme [Phycisphaerae bacterium]